MPETACYVPIRVRVCGDLGDAQLEQLEPALRRAITARLGLVARTLLADGRGPDGVVREEYQAERHQAGARLYSVPSYEEPQTVAVPLRRAPDVEQAALARIHSLLSAGLFDSVSEEEARAVLGVLRVLEAEELLRTVMAMRLSSDWSTFRRSLGLADAAELTALEIMLDPSAGVLMPGDDIRIEVYAGPYLERDLSLEYNVLREGVRPLPLERAVDVIGALPEEAATRLAQAFHDELIVLEPRVRLVVTRRGSLFAPHAGPAAGAVWFESAPVARARWDAHRRARRVEFNAYIALVPIRDVRTANAVGHYLDWIEANDQTQEFLTRPPSDLWEWALRRAHEPPPATPLQPFLQLLQSTASRIAAAPAGERARLQAALGRYMDWLEQHREDRDLARYDPVEIWIRAYQRTLEAEFRESEFRRRREAALRAQFPEPDWERVGRKLDEAHRLLAERVLRMPETRRVEAPSEGVGYLVWGSQLEREARERIASGFISDVYARALDPGFPATSAQEDFVAWLQSHPAQYAEFLLAQAYPETERYEVELDIPAWQTAIEVAVGFIPIVGQVAAAGELVTGRDLFGNPLSTTDRAIIGASLLLPAAGRIFRLGRAAVTVPRISEMYRLSEPEARALFRATAEIGPGTYGQLLLRGALEDIRLRGGVRDPERLRRVEQLLRDMGMTERSTAQALSQRGAARAAEEVTEVDPIVPREGGRGGAGAVEPPPPAGGGGGGGGGLPRAPTLLQRQRGAALRSDAASLEREIAALRNEADEMDRTAAAAGAGNPERAVRLRRRADQRRRVATLLQDDVADLRRQADEFERGARSATADLPGAEDVEFLVDQARAETELIRVPLAVAERNPELLPRLVRGLLQSRRGARVVYRVEGGGSRTLIDVAANGDVAITRGQTIYLNFGSPERALEFVTQNRGTGARVVAFEVDEQWVQSLRSAAIPEFRTGPLAGRQPRLVDIRFAEDQMEIPSSLIDELVQFIVPGSGRSVEVR